MNIYQKKVRSINIDELLMAATVTHSEEAWGFTLHETLTLILRQKLDLLDFHSYQYINDYGVYWSGVLTQDPFDDLYDRHDSEESILNEIMHHHIRIVHEDGVNYLKFDNPSTSPLYDFFKTYEKSGCGGNIPYSLNGLLTKLEDYLKKDFARNMSEYGTWNILQLN